MGRITYDLLRKRSEHNEGIVSTMEEVSLHQQDLEKIELLGHTCRHLKILYLQSNLISRIENLHRLKALEYLNMAVNNVTRIQNLQKCESLKKLDLTVNFIDKAGLLTIHSLKANLFLRELFLVGNPCCDWPGYRPYVIASLPQLARLDGKDIKPSERIQAAQDLPGLEQQLREELRAEGIDPDAASLVENMGEEDETEEIQETGTVGEDGELRRPWCPQTRILEHREMERERLAAEEQRRESQAKAMLDEGPGRKAPRHEDFPELGEGEEVRQKNEGEYDFMMRESDDYLSVELEVKVSKFLDTSLIKLDIRPTVIRLLIKGRLLQLTIPEEIRPDSSVAQRSKASGSLVITMPKVDKSGGANPLLAPPKNPLARPCAPQRRGLAGLEAELEAASISGSDSAGAAGGARRAGGGVGGSAGGGSRAGVVDLTNVVGVAGRARAAAAAQAAGGGVRKAERGASMDPHNSLHFVSPMDVGLGMAISSVEEPRTIGNGPGPKRPQSPHSRPTPTTSIKAIPNANGRRNHHGHIQPVNSVPVAPSAPMVPPPGATSAPTGSPERRASGSYTSASQRRANPMYNVRSEPWPHKCNEVGGAHSHSRGNNDIMFHSPPVLSVLIEPKASGTTATYSGGSAAGGASSAQPSQAQSRRASLRAGITSQRRLDVGECQGLSAATHPPRDRRSGTNTPTSTSQVLHPPQAQVSSQASQQPVSAPSGPQSHPRGASPTPGVGPRMGMMARGANSRRNFAFDPELSKAVNEELVRQRVHNAQAAGAVRTQPREGVQYEKA